VYETVLVADGGNVLVDANVALVLNMA